MKHLNAALVLLSAAAVGLTFYARQQVHASTPAAFRSPVIVELFTSEGCSSCPPADQFLAKLEAEQPIENAEVIALEEHVDYWNNLGWTDPFSSDSATIRQYAYTGEIGNGNAYTPQMVVDGQEEFVGSRERQARGVIERAANRKKAEVNVNAGQSAPDGTQIFEIKVGTLPDSATGDKPEVWMAITETGLHSDVKRGENAGEELHHASIVRKLRKIGAASAVGEPAYASEEKLKLDRTWKRENVRIVIFVQEQKSKRILGAGSAAYGS
ncbi:MAG: DUF1223 domain-containing protein [Candidatus Acidiferrum sp.]